MGVKEGRHFRFKVVAVCKKNVEVLRLLPTAAWRLRATVRLSNGYILGLKIRSDGWKKTLSGGIATALF